jgi:hypothetical protein
MRTRRMDRLRRLDRSCSGLGAGPACKARAASALTTSRLLAAGDVRPATRVATSAGAGAVLAADGIDAGEANHLADLLYRPGTARTFCRSLAPRHSCDCANDCSMPLLPLRIPMLTL